MNKYPLWKYSLLVFILVIGVIYALPNLFGEDPSLQVSPSSSQFSLNQAVIAKITAALKMAALSPKAIKHNENNVLFRFKDPNQQLRAKSVVNQALADKQGQINYTVALNLAPATPRWLMALGALPMKLGLDLRGGVHFLVFQ